ncbi:cobalt ECF transporter T component CbiQ [Desulfohalobiaceae bacterium Ax17]|uniref:cobalt ECF transporter T component CbiQ n=1 Tax=Desulfovulcanus ferrireducens TaxID=2831190 RepID=UPI00207BA936|nr:cobalt ECF transporter T component CbiQ [Desulfovulcanus ferrireducens]MBT8762708.1 cobalt ECF transporter T component CbiQ [Desulfovulcanus ferrireducens]
MLEQEFIAYKSFIHSLDPRIRLVQAFILSVVLALSSSLPVLSAGIASAVILYFLSCLPLQKLLSRLLVINTFILFLWAVLPFSYPGQTLFSLGPLSASKEGLILALQITLKANAIMTIFIALISTIPVPTIGYALQQLGLPEKLTYLLIFSFRYIFVLEEEKKRLLRSLKVRGFNPKTNLHTYKTYACLLGLILVRSWDRAEQVHKAMLCRGFQGKFYSLHKFSLTKKDFSFFLTSSIFASVLLMLEYINPIFFK